MWTEKTKNGRYKFIERYKDPHTLKYKRVSVVLDKHTAQTIKTATALLQAKIAKAKNEAMNPAAVTLATLAGRYIEHQQTTVRASTYKRNYYAINTLCGILGRDTLAATLSAAFIRDRFLSSGKAPGTLNEHLARLKAWLRWCYSCDLVYDIAYLDKLQPFHDTPHRVKIADKFLEREELQAILDTMEKAGHLDHYYMTKFLVATGLRIGEAIALQMDDIDKANMIIHITKTFDPTNNIVTPPKTLSSNRDIPINAALLALIGDIEAYYNLLGHAIHISGKLLFRGKNGHHVEYYTYNKFLRDTVHRIGINKPITAHALRHTYASLMLEAGAGVGTISRLLGHENSKITREIYLHVTEKLKNQDFEEARAISII